MAGGASNAITNMQGRARQAKTNTENKLLAWTGGGKLVFYKVILP